MGDMHAHKPPVPASSSLAVTFDGKTVTFTLAELQAMPQVTVHVHNGHSNADEDYAGPLLAELLAKAGLVASHDTEPMILHSAVLAGATDKYVVVYSCAEVLPGFANGKVIVALTRNGQPDTGGGTIQLINTTDVKPARWVHGLNSISVTTVAAGAGMSAMKPMR